MGQYMGPISDEPAHQWDVERVCRWAQVNGIPEFQAPIRSEEIDGEGSYLHCGQFFVAERL